MRVLVKAFPDQPARKGYFGNLGEAASQFVGAVFGLNANLTFSAHCGYWQETGKTLLKYLHVPVNIVMSLPRIIDKAGLKWLHGVNTKVPWVDKHHCLDAWRKRT